MKGPPEATGADEADLGLEAPIFVIGNPRSGTTLLRLMLTCHPAITIPPECGFAVWLRDLFYPWHPDHLNSFAEAVHQSRKFETWGISFEQLRAFLKSRRPRNYSEAVSCVYACYAKTHESPFRRWGDKNNYYLNHIPVLDEMFPAAFYIHIVRDGRDVACSYRKLAAAGVSSQYAPKLPASMDEVAHVWAGNLRTIRKSLARIDPERTATVRYEDLVQHPEQELQRLCRLLGEPFDSRMLRHQEFTKRHGLEPSEFLQWKKKILEPAEATRVGSHRREVSAPERQRFEAIGRDMLELHGYSSSE